MTSDESDWLSYPEIRSLENFLIHRAENQRIVHILNCKYCSCLHINYELCEDCTTFTEYSSFCIDKIQQNMGVEQLTYLIDFNDYLIWRLNVTSNRES